MTYRDENDGLRRRVEALEADLAGARATIARLQGETSAARAVQKADWFTGAPFRLELDRELPFEVTDQGYEAIAELLRARYPTSMGGVSQVGRTLSYRAGGVLEVQLSRVAPGRTRLLLRGDHRGHAVILGATTPAASLFGLGGAVAILEALKATPVAVILVLPLVVLTCFLAIRALVGRSVLRDRKKMVGILESVAELAAQHAVPQRTRIALTAGSEEPAAAEVEAEQAELAAGEARSAAGHG